MHLMIQNMDALLDTFYMYLRGRVEVLFID